MSTSERISLHPSLHQHPSQLQQEGPTIMDPYLYSQNWYPEWQPMPVPPPILQHPVPPFLELPPPVLHQLQMQQQHFLQQQMFLQQQVYEQNLQELQQLLQQVLQGQQQLQQQPVPPYLELSPPVLHQQQQQHSSVQRQQSSVQQRQQHSSGQQQQKHNPCSKPWVYKPHLCFPNFKPKHDICINEWDFKGGLVCNLSSLFDGCGLENAEIPDVCDPSVQDCLAWDRVVQKGSRFSLDQLFTDKRDYIGSHGRRLYKSDLEGKTLVVAGFYIPVDGKAAAARWSRTLISVYNDMKSSPFKDEFEMVIIPRLPPNLADCQEAKRMIDDFCGCFPCACVYDDDPDFSAGLFRYMGIWRSLKASLIISDPTGCVVQAGFPALTLFGAEYYPFGDKYLKELEVKEAIWKPTLQYLLSPFYTLEKSPLPDSLLVLIYVAKDLSLIPFIRECKDFPSKEFELVIVKHPDEDGLHIPEDITYRELPLRDHVARRLWRLGGYRESDLLVVVGPNSSFIKFKKPSSLKKIGAKKFLEYSIAGE